MALVAAALNLMADALGNGTAPLNNIKFVSLHTADPLLTGGNEVTGGAPAYARKSIAFVNPTVGGDLNSSNQPIFDVPAGVTITHVGYWSAVTAGIFYGAAAITNEAFTGQGTYTLTDADVVIT